MSTTNDRHVISIDGTGRVTVSIAFYPTGTAGGGGGGGSTAQTGDMKMGLWTVAETGWVLMLASTTIGSLASGATYADADAAALYTLLWTNLANAQAPVTGGRGGSAAADFAANKKLQLPSMQRTVPMGFDDSQSVVGVDCLLGKAMGSNLHTLLDAELPITAAHTHAFTGNGHVHGLAAGTTEHDHPVEAWSSSISTNVGNTAVQTVGETPNEAPVLTGLNAAGSATESAVESGTTDAAGGFGGNNQLTLVQLSLCVNYAIKL